MSVNKPEAQPSKGTKEIWLLVIAYMQERNSIGTKKYGTPLMSHNGRDALIDAYQEALDLCVYLRQAIEEQNND